MTAVLLFTLFAGTAALSIGAMAVSWRQHGAAALAIRSQLRACSPVREFRFTITETQVGPERTNLTADIPAAKIYRPDFRKPARRLPAQPALPAAA